MYSTILEEPIRVLLVENQHFTRLGLRSALSSSQAIHVCAEAEGLDAALEVLKKESVDVAVIGTDSGGSELCRALRESHPHLRVLMLLSGANPDLVRSFSGEVHAYGLKNLNAHRLMAAIITAFHGDTWMDASLAEGLFRQLLHSGRPGGAIRDNAVSNDGEISGGSDGSNPRCSTLLTERETEVLALIVQGLTNQAIADRLVVSLATAKAHVRSILCKLSVAHRTEAAVEAIRRGLV